MAYLLFIDESGTDHKASPYEVLAGVAIEASRVWALITAVHDAEELFFGQRISDSALELKAKKLLKVKTFRLARGEGPIARLERTRLANECLVEGATAKREQRPANVSRRHLAALAQAKLAFCERILELCTQHHARAFASIVDRDAPRPSSDGLRKDFAYLFERFFYFLDERGGPRQGIVVFDERDQQQCITLLEQMASYFKNTATGRHRASKVIPEPFFVRSELCTLVQVADIVAYTISWGLRVGPKMTRPARPELASLAEQVRSMRYRAVREREEQPFYVWSFAVIDDLRPRDEKSG